MDNRAYDFPELLAQAVSAILHTLTTDIGQSITGWKLYINMEKVGV